MIYGLTGSHKRAALSPRENAYSWEMHCRPRFTSMKA